MAETHSRLKPVCTTVDENQAPRKLSDFSLSMVGAPELLGEAELRCWKSDAIMAAIAPHRLDEMEGHESRALAAALSSNEIGHLQYWLPHWAAETEIERRPDLSARRSRALTAVQEPPAAVTPL
ncbi:hypothetical protein ACFV7Q_26235 [Streptomyces sp. NPDC059851]|uniref:hypothetical protein n=1 Tax=Streptomyces sp. NPDC059851 TaxID=3346971 RepID=UPI0036617447